MPKCPERVRFFFLCASIALAATVAHAQQPAPIVLHAARLLQVDTGTLLQPGEILVEGDRIRVVASSVDHPQGTKIIARNRASSAEAASESLLLDYKISEFKRQIAAGIPFAVGSDVGPFPHGTQAVELELMVRYGMKPLAVLQADMIEGTRLLGWEGQIGQLKPGFFADVIAVPGNPLEDIKAVEHVSFVMKNGVVVRP